MRGQANSTTHCHRLFIGICLLSLGVEAMCQCARSLGDKALFQQFAPGKNQPQSYLVIEQADADVLVVVITSETSFAVDSPAPRNIAEIISLSPQVYGASPQQVCLYASTPPTVAAGGDHGGWLRRVAGDALESEAAQTITRASILWRGATQVKKERAIDLYESTLAQVSQRDSPLHTPLIFYTLLANLTLNRLSRVMAGVNHQSQRLLKQPQHRYIAKWIKAQATLDISKPKAAIPDFLEAIAIAEALNARAANHRLNIVEMKNALGEAYLSAGLLDAGEKYILEANSAPVQDNLLRSKLVDHTAYLYLEKARRSQGENYHRLQAKGLQAEYEALHYAVLADDVLQRIEIHNNIASFHQRRFALASALRNYQITVHLLKALGDAAQHVYPLRNTGHIYLELGRARAAITVLQKYLQVLDASNLAERAEALCSIADAHRYLNHHRRGFEGHARCLNLIAGEIADGGETRGKYLNVYIKALLGLIDYFTEEDDLVAADFYVTKVAAILPRLTDKRLTAKAHVSIARYHLRDARPDRAAAAVERALAASDYSINPAAQVEALMVGKEIMLARGRRAEAIAYMERAITASESVLAHLDPIELGPAWSNRIHRVYTELIDIKLTQIAENAPADKDNIAAIFAIVERSRAANVRRLIQADFFQRSDTLPEDLSRIRKLSNDLAQEVDTTQIGYDLIAEKSTLRLAKGAHLSREELKHFKRKQTSHKTPQAARPPPLTLSAMREKMDAETLALVFQVSDDNVHALLIGKAEQRLIALGSAASLQQEVHALLGAMKNGAASGRALRRAVGQLSSRLILPLAKHIGGKKLVLMPHKFLNYLPFSMLSLSADHYKPLASQNAIFTTPSLSTLYGQISTRPPPDAKTIAVMANPVFNQRQFSARKVTKTFRKWSNTLEPLPHSAREARHLQSLFGERNALVFTERDATYRNLFRRDVRQANILHLATHGYFSDANPENVGFILSAFDRDGAPQQGFVTLTDIFSHTFDNQLVVISGCETAMGQSLNGEGLQGLARAFIARGAKNVIATLWPVADDAAAEFMKVFYFELKQGVGIAESLRRTQAALYNSEAYSHPFYWAPYVHYTVGLDQVRLRFY